MSALEELDDEHGSATVRANEKLGYIFPARAGRETFFRTAFFFFVNPPADDTHPDFVITFRHDCVPVTPKKLV